MREKYGGMGQEAVMAESWEADRHSARWAVRAWVLLAAVRHRRPLVSGQDRRQGTH